MPRADAVEIYELYARVCKALADPKRLLIINELRDGPRPVGEIAAALGISQANASQHLAILRDKGVLQTRKDANRVFYRVADKRTLQLVALMREVFCGVAP